MKPVIAVKPVSFRLLSVSALLALSAAALWAAPSLSVQKPPILSGVNPNTGPAAVDPTAARGQWFRNLATGQVFFLNNQFHDNVSGRGGGLAGSRAIYGSVGVINYAAGPGTNILSFDLRVLVFNDTDSVSGAWQAGGNSHAESRFTTPLFKGRLERVVLVTEFALLRNALFPIGPVAGTPYTLSPGPRIVALNNTLAAWYCFNNTLIPGNYYVPAWEMPNIPVGASASIGLRFGVLDGGIPPGDPRYSVLVNSLATGSDIFSSRSTSLKISNWVDRLWLDNGAPYFNFSGSSDVDVFHFNPHGF